MSAQHDAAGGLHLMICFDAAGGAHFYPQGDPAELAVRLGKIIEILHNRPAAILCAAGLHVPTGAVQ